MQIWSEKSTFKLKAWFDLILHIYMIGTKPPHLDADQDAPLPDHFDKGYAIVRVLIQRLMEEDDTSKAAVDAIICAEENLPELSAVLLRVLYSDLGQPLGHAACSNISQDVNIHSMLSLDWLVFICVCMSMA